VINYSPTLSERLGELWSLTNKVIGAHVDPPTINTALAVYANVTAFGTRDVATSRISTT